MPTAAPRSFDLLAHYDAIQVEQATGIRSAGRLDPDGAADAADNLRTRVRGLRLGSWMMVIAAAVLVLGELEILIVRRFSNAVGVLVGVVAATVTFVAVY